jgi:cell division septation protein DedD
MTVTAKAVDVAKVYTVQIASYRSEQEASAGWQALTTEQGDLLAKLPHAVAKADLGAEKGVFYRLQAGAFSDRKEAKALCSDLKDHSIDCMVVEATSATAAPGSSQQSMLDPDNSFVIGAR